jgi:predicted RNA polymerase sigma factor
VAVVLSSANVVEPVKSDVVSVGEVAKTISPDPVVVLPRSVNVPDASGNVYVLATVAPKTKDDAYAALLMIKPNPFDPDAKAYIVLVLAVPETAEA